MSASTNDKITDIRNAARPNSARASGTRSTGGTSLACDNLAGWPTASKVHFVTYQVDSNSNPVSGTQLDCYGIVSGNTIGSFVVVDGSDTGNSIGDYVEMLPTAAWGQDLADALTHQHSRIGAHVGITNTGGLTTDTLNVSGATNHTGPTTLTGAVGGVGYSVATISNPYKFSVYRNAAQNTGAASDAVVNFDTKEYDTGSNVDVVTNKGRFTAPIAGFYWFEGTVNCASGTYLIVSLYKNGVLAKNGTNYTGSAGSTSGLVTATLQLAANDYVEVFSQANIAKAIGTGATNTHFSGFLISAT